MKLFDQYSKFLSKLEGFREGRFMLIQGKLVFEDYETFERFQVTEKDVLEVSINSVDFKPVTFADFMFLSVGQSAYGRIKKGE